MVCATTTSHSRVRLVEQNKQELSSSGTYERLEINSAKRAGGGEGRLHKRFREEHVLPAATEIRRHLRRQPARGEALYGGDGGR